MHILVDCTNVMLLFVIFVDPPACAGVLVVVVLRLKFELIVSWIAMGGIT